MTESQEKRITELLETVKKYRKEKTQKERALGVRRSTRIPYDDYCIIRRALVNEAEKLKEDISKLDAELREWQDTLPVATPENVEAIKRRVRMDREESGIYAALKGVDYITSNAGTKNERLFMESQIREIFREVTGEES